VQAEAGREALAVAVTRLEEELAHRNSALLLAAEQVCGEWVVLEQVCGEWEWQEQVCAESA
jgi:hypothetical protein